MAQSWFLEYFKGIHGIRIICVNGLLMLKARLLGGVVLRVVVCPLQIILDIRTIVTHSIAINVCLYLIFPDVFCASIFGPLFRLVYRCSAKLILREKRIGIG
jgi:hypothetical protein